MREQIEKFDHVAMRAIARHRNPAVTSILRVITITGEGRWWALVVATFAIGTYFKLIHFPRREFIFYATIAPGIAWIFVRILKLVVHRRRPFQILADYPALSPAPKNDSFPSGHTASAFAFFVAMSPVGGVAAVALGIWAGIVSFSRYYLGVHFPSDIFVGMLIGIASGAGWTEVRSAFAGDYYPNVTNLMKHEREGIDYRVAIHDRKSEILVLAIHGGRIESGSAELADAIAGADWNEYAFLALKPENNSKLHVTSAHFDDPRALALAGKSRLCISIHGFKEPVKEVVCAGGGNVAARARVEAALKKAFPDILFRSDCESIDGANGKNIVNRCREKGVQLELSRALRKRLLKDPVALSTFAMTVRAAVGK